MRRKVQISCTLSHVAADQIEELMALTGWDRSRCIEECVRAYAPELIRRFRKFYGKTETETGSEAEELQRRYMWKLITGDIEEELRKAKEERG